VTTDVVQPEAGRDASSPPTLDLTITISAYNTRDVLRGCLESVYRHTNGINFEIICIDDCSGDGSAAMVQKQFPGVRLVRNSINQRYAKNQNLGMTMSRARYACWLDSDTLLTGNVFAALVKFMDDHPEAAVCAPKLLNLDGTIQHSIRTFAGPLTFILQGLNWHKLFRNSGLTDRYYNTCFDYSRPQVVDSIGTSVYLVRRSTWENVGMLDEQMGQHIVDLAYNYKLKQQGLKVYYVPCPPVIHLGSQSINQMVLTAHREQCRSLLWFNNNYNYFGSNKVIKLLVSGGVRARYYSKVLGFYLSSDKRVVKGPGAPRKATRHAEVIGNPK
jgi:GT2 family glycosyltransferase